MGQFIEQVQALNSTQNEILTERKRKQKEKERKEFLQYLFNKHKLQIIEQIERISDKPYNDILYNDIIINIFTSYTKDLKKYNIDGIEAQLKLKELEKFTYKEILQQKARQNKIKTEEAATGETWKTDLYFLIDRSYKKYNYETFNKLNNCKFELLEKYKPFGYNYKDIEFFNRINNKYRKKYPTPKQTNYISAILLGSLFGIFRGYKANTKRKPRRARF